MTRKEIRDKLIDKIIIGILASVVSSLFLLGYSSYESRIAQLQKKVDLQSSFIRAHYDKAINSIISFGQLQDPRHRVAVDLVFDPNNSADANLAKLSAAMLGHIANVKATLSVIDASAMPTTIAEMTDLETRMDTDLSEFGSSLRLPNGSQEYILAVARMNASFGSEFANIVDREFNAPYAGLKWYEAFAVPTKPAFVLLGLAGLLLLILLVVYRRATET